LEGAKETLGRRAIRDIVFEDFNPQPSPVSQILLQNGYQIFEMHADWLRPRLVELAQAGKTKAGFSYNYLATLEPARAVKRFQASGWHCLSCPGR
jgi:hypothetical protein